MQIAKNRQLRPSTGINHGLQGISKHPWQIFWQSATSDMADPVNQTFFDQRQYRLDINARRRQQCLANRLTIQFGRLIAELDVIVLKQYLTHQRVAIGVNSG